MTTVSRLPQVLPLRPAAWVLACALAEMIGMTASATAARVAGGLPLVAGLGVVILGGLIEGTALGILQSTWLAHRFPGVSRVGWIVTTILIAGIGWAAASAPAALSPDDGVAPSVLLVLAGAAGLGLVMGAVMGVAQAFVLRGAVRHPWRWISISAISWTPTMVVIFAGATLPDASWPTSLVIPWGALTGLVAGAILGAVSLALLPTLNGISSSSHIIGWALKNNLFGFGRSLTLLRITGVRTGRSFEFPVQYVRDGDRIVVLPGRAEHKTWWRNLRQPHRVDLLVGGSWRPAIGRVLGTSSPEFGTGRAAYAKRWPALRPAADAVLVGFEFDPPSP
jgi:hypothetical protein